MTLFAILALLASAAEVDDDTVATRLVALAHESGEVVLVAVQDSDARALVSEIADFNPEIYLRSERIEPDTTKEEVLKLLADSGLRCGVKLNRGGDGWSMHKVGDCSADGSSWDASIHRTEAAPAEQADVPDEPPPPTRSAPPERTRPPKERSNTASSTRTSVPTPPTTARPATARKVSTEVSDEQIRRIIAANKRIAIAQVKAPDPAAAGLYSLVLGFGAGHYYAENTETAQIHTGVQIGGLALAVGGAVMAANANSTQKANRAVLLSNVGYLTFSIGRLIDFGTAPQAARRTAAAKITAR